MIQNGIIINGVTYEFALNEAQGNDCEECALHEMCREMQGNILCGVLFDSCVNKTFKRVGQ